MKIYEAYELAIKLGMSKDPRPDDEVRRVLEEARKEYDSSDDSERELFDAERLWNPYYDCRFSYGADEAREAVKTKLQELVKVMRDYHVRSVEKGGDE